MLRNVVNLIPRSLGKVGSGLVLGSGLCLAPSRLPDLKCLCIGYVAQITLFMGLLRGTSNADFLTLTMLFGVSVHLSKLFPW